MKEPRFNIGDKVVPSLCTKEYQEENVMIVSDIKEKSFDTIIEDKECIYKYYIYKMYGDGCGWYVETSLELWESI